MAISINSQPVQNTLEQYVPLPLDMMMRAGAATQARYDQAVADDTALQTGIASTEARAPAYRDFIKNTLSSYKSEMGELVDKFGGRMDDPEFRRQSKVIQNRYLNNPTWSQIKLGNENIRRTEDIQAKLRAEGKLFISDLPDFKGVDSNGNVIAFNGGIESVNTLDDWEKATKQAWASKINDNHGTISNEKNLKKNMQAMLNNVANGGVESQKLIKAYIQQGYTPEQARSQVMKNISTLASSYAIERDRDNAYWGQLQSASQFREQMDFRYKQLEAKRQADALKAQAKAAKAGKPEVPVITPYSTPVNRLSNVTTGGLKTIVADQSNVQLNLPIDKPTRIEGKFFRVNPEQEDNKGFVEKGGFNINSGTFVGYKNIWVTEKGNLLLTGKDRQVEQRTDPKTGQVKNYIGNQPVKKQTVAEYQEVHKDGSGTNAKYSTPVTYYQFADRDRAIQYMGAENAHYEGKGSKDPFMRPSAVKIEGNKVLRKNGITIPQDRLSTLIQNGILDNEQIAEVDRLVKEFNTGKGIKKSEYETLRQLFSDETMDKIYHKTVIQPQYMNTGKQKAQSPNPTSVRGRIANDTQNDEESDEEYID